MPFGLNSGLFGLVEKKEELLRTVLLGFFHGLRCISGRPVKDKPYIYILKCLSGKKRASSNYVHNGPNKRGALLKFELNLRDGFHNQLICFVSSLLSQKP